ncbi:MAG: AFG1/ZapE family ATPase [Gammaproteobacteria bacterium]
MWSGLILPALCDGPRSARDYIEIARSFQTVLNFGVPVLDETRENAARRFIALVDEFYDRRVNLIVSAAAALDASARKPAQPEVERTRSRLPEMRSVEYWRPGICTSNPVNRAAESVIELPYAQEVSAAACRCRDVCGGQSAVDVCRP